MSWFPKREFFWNEPYFFIQRIRTTGDWIKLIVGCLVLGIVATAILFFLGTGIPKSVAIGMGVGLLGWFVYELLTFSRTADMDENNLVVEAGGGKYRILWTYPLRAMTNAVISRKGENNSPFAILHFMSEGNPAAVGLPGEMRIERLAIALHRLGVPIQLSNWTPPDANAGLENELAFAPDVHRGDVPVKVTAMPETERIDTSAGENITALLIAFWPMLIWLGGLIGMGVYAYMNWKNVDSTFAVVALVFGIFGLLAATTYLSSFGEYWAGLLLTKATKDRIRKRSGVIVDIDHPESVAVSILAKKDWGEALQKPIDMGMLYADKNRGVLLFEGNKERMEIPREAIQTMRVAEVQYGSGGDAAFSELRCFVAIALNRGDWTEEVGLRNETLIPGATTDSRRFQLASALFEKLKAFCAKS